MSDIYLYAADILAVGWALALAVALARLHRDTRELERRIRWLETHPGIVQQQRQECTTDIGGPPP